MNHVTNGWVAVRHGVILGAGESPAAAAAAAAAAARVSRCEVRPATPRDLAFEECGRPMPVDERALLKAIRTDYRRLSRGLECYVACPYGIVGCGGYESCNRFEDVRFGELVPPGFPKELGEIEDLRSQLRARIESIGEELAGLDFADRQPSLFEALPA